MTQKWAYFIMVNHTIFSSGTELVRDRKICPLSSSPNGSESSRLSTPTEKSELRVRLDAQVRDFLNVD